MKTNNDNIPLVTHHDKDRRDDNDYDGYNTSNTSTVDEIAYTTPSSTDSKAKSALRLKQKVKRDKLPALYRHLNVTDNLNQVEADRLKLKKKLKAGNTDLLFFDVRNLQSLNN